MQANVAQRWRQRRDSYRPVGEPIRTERYDVAEIRDDTTARAFVTAHHYSGSYPAARRRFGLYEHGELVGVAVFSHPCNDRVLTNTFPGVTRHDAVELGRFVLLDSVPANGETWFLARAFDQLRGDLAGVVSFADPVRRAALCGRVVTPGHVGTIYQAFNGVYLGRGTPRRLRLLPDGRVLSDRAIQKIRRRERGWRYAAALLEAFGAERLGDADAAAWLEHWLPRLTRVVRHPGNHRYAWALSKAVRRGLRGREQSYPKRGIAA